MNLFSRVATVLASSLALTLLAVVFVQDAHADGDVHEVSDLNACYLTWNPVIGADVYRVLSGTSDASVSFVFETTGTRATCPQMKINGYGQWHVWVRARNAVGTGDPAKLPFVLEPPKPPEPEPTKPGVTDQVTFSPQ